MLQGRFPALYIEDHHQNPWKEWRISTPFYRDDNP